MLVPPIIGRELRVALRRHGAAKSRFKTAAGAATFVAIFLLFGWFFNSSQPARTLHVALFLGGLYLAVIPAAQISVGLFCEERTNQTLELLYLTGMGSAELFAGKLLSGALIASNNLLALTPFLAVPFFSGGLSLNLFLATIGCLPVVLLLTISIGVLGSVLCRDDGAALVCAVVLGAAICLALPLPYYLGKTITGAVPFSAKWLCLSPAYGPYLVGFNFSGATPREFWLTTGLTVVWSIVALGVAALCLRRNWRNEIQKNAPGGWIGKWESWVHGPVVWRENLRTRLLAQYPFQWLAQQDRRPVMSAWGLMAAVILLWLMGWAAWPRYWPSPVNLYITASLLILGVDFIMRFAAAKPISAERRGGSLELLLTTPLGPEDILMGQMAATRAQFKPVRWALTTLCMIMMFGGLLTRHWTRPAMVSYGFIWLAILTIVWRIQSNGEGVPRAMWIGLWSGRPMYAVLPRRGKYPWIWWIWMATNLPNLWRGLLRAGSFPSGSAAEVTIVVNAFVIFFIIVVAATTTPAARPLERRLVTEMRLIARQPLPDTRDPRFRKWDMDENPPAPVYVRTYPERMGLGGYAGRKLGRVWGRVQARRQTKQAAKSPR